MLPAYRAAVQTRTISEKARMVFHFHLYSPCPAVFIGYIDDSMHGCGALINRSGDKYSIDF
jgi:hypothetical protein